MEPVDEASIGKRVRYASVTWPKRWDSSLADS